MLDVDVLFPLELYADLISKRYYAAFAWSLLNAIVALETNPPKFRTPRLMTGLLVEGGADMEAVSACVGPVPPPCPGDGVDCLHACMRRVMVWHHNL